MQVSKSSVEYLNLEQKLNDIILAHQLNPSKNGMFVKGEGVNALMGCYGGKPLPCFTFTNYLEQNHFFVALLLAIHDLDWSDVTFQCFSSLRWGPDQLFRVYFAITTRCSLLQVSLVKHFQHSDMR